MSSNQKAITPAAIGKSKLIDAHTHLEMSRFDEDREEVIARAFACGLEAMITVASDPQSNRVLSGIAEAHEGIYFTVGLHPHDAKFMTDDMLAEFRTLAGHAKAVAIGETGLDYHYDNSPREDQRRAFRAQLALANELGLPVVIHSREADDDTCAIIREAGVTNGVLHCFSGSGRLLDLALEQGLHMSIAGPVTFPKAVELRSAVQRIPDDLLMVETDAPFLAPAPMRGKRNEPAYVIHTAAEVARIRGVSPDDIARITTVNARGLFGLPGAKGAQGELAYAIRDSLYLNLTNRCTNACTFCVRFHKDFVKGHNLRLSREPTAVELIAAIGDPSAYREVVFCGYGEPMLRLDVIKDVSAWVKARGGRVRINTNGQADLIHGRDVLPELAGLVDEFSVSLDAQDEATYERLCKPMRPGAFNAVKEFIRRAAGRFEVVRATIVTAEGVDVEACRRLAGELGAELRVRELDVVG